MKFNFKIQQYQTDAVESTVAVFAGQPTQGGFLYRRDLGKNDAGRITYEDDYAGFRNADVELSDQNMLANIRNIQESNNIPLSKALSHDLGKVGLDIEMETGTGKTYVYIKTMFELNRRYGWSKFIVVVPSIAIREGIAKSFKMLEDHFMEYYGKKARYFIYNSSNLQQLDSFSSDASINVMIINTQAFASSLKEGAKNKDSLYAVSALREYEGFTISEINACNDSVTFTNGVTVHKGEVYGDSSQETMQRVQIRETIASHFEKEQELYGKGIKTLSLFFLDEVANYKSYNEEGAEIKGRLWNIFEEEYSHYLDDNLSLFDDDYQRYLRHFDVSQVHRGYFSIDKKTGHSIDSETKRGSDTSDDISAYDLILKNKERLLSFEEPCRFIFSHSALREGWDNPNVFQICTLRHANSAIAKRQEVGRGLRICVDQQGNRMDYQELGEDVQEVNKLTVITNESYTDFVDGLQKETKEALRERPTKADIKFFEGKVVTRADGGRQTLNVQDAMMIVGYLLGCGYVDENNNITQRYKEDLKDKTLKPMFPGLQPVEAEVHKLIQSIYDERVELVNMVENGYSTKTSDNALNANFGKKEFQELWKLINHKYVYTVHYDSKELIDHAVCSINSNLFVSELKYVMTIGDQNDVDSFGGEQTTTKSITTVSTSTVPYDLVGEISKRSTLTRRTAASILRSISPQKLAMFRGNPEEFITKVSRLIKEEKATIIVEHIRYDKLEETYDSDIFTKEKRSQDIGKAYRATKSIQDYVFTDGIADDNNEKKFARSLDQATEVCVYAKLPRGFQIPTPVGNYSPDWAIAFNEGTVKHVFFIAETKGDMSTMELRPIETAKINCARALFNNLSGADVRYDCVKSYDDLLTVMQK